MQQAAETVVAKRQISLWTEREKSAFMDAYKVLSIARIIIIRGYLSSIHITLIRCLAVSGQASCIRGHLV